MTESHCVYIAVHGGAGNHSHASEKETKRALKRACTRAITSLLAHESALTGVVEAVVVLEDEPCLNAGYGSNLTIDGTVECDAAIMDGRSQDFGSVGAVSGVKNPIRLAESILQNSRVPDKIGRIPPLTLVSHGASSFAASHLPEEQMIPPDSLITTTAKKDWQKWLRRLESTLPVEPPVEGLHDIQDTVGAVAWDHNGDLAASVSSGGLLLKHPGRVGEAAIFGAGCWAQHYTPSEGIACSISGAGEHIIRANLAHTLGLGLDPHSSARESTSKSTTNQEECGGPDVHEILERVLADHFSQSCRARGDSQADAGILMIVKELNSAGISTGM